MSTKLLSETICRKGLMVKCFVALIVFCCSVGEAFAQTNTKVTINVNNVLIRTALDQLQREAKIHFVYDEENIDSGKRVSLSYTETPLNAVLDDFCKQTSLRYEVKRNLILILPSKAEKTTGKHEPFYMTGVVTDETGESIIGATIMIGGTSQGTVTDIDGRYSLQVTPGDLVSFTFVGMADKVVKVQAGKKVVNVKMETNATALADVVVTGYQTLSKERATGSYSVISEKSTKGKLETDVLSRIEGLVAGINKTSSNSNDVVIRGITTYMGNTKPLYVVDGMPYEGDLASINPTDVQNITVLKDAAASSIYGARAANGVIVITTKRGQEGKTKVSYNGSIKLSPKPDFDYLNLMSSSELVDMQIEGFDYYHTAYENLNKRQAVNQVVDLLYQHERGQLTDSQLADALLPYRTNDNRKQIEDEFARVGIVHQHNLAISGGSNKNRYMATVNYMGDYGNQKYQSKDRIGFSLKDDVDFFDWLSADFGVTGSFYRSKGDNGAGSYSSLMSSYPSYYMLRDLQGNPLNFQRTKSDYELQRLQSIGLMDETYSPIKNRAEESYHNNSNYYRLHAGLKFKLLEGLNIDLKYQTEGTYDKNRTLYSNMSYTVRNMINDAAQYDAATGSLTLNVPKGGQLDESRYESYSYTMRAQVNFNRIFGKHAISALGGAERRLVRRTGAQNYYMGYDDNSLGVKPINPLAMSPINGTDFGARSLDDIFYFIGKKNLSVATLLEKVNPKKTGFFDNLSKILQRNNEQREKLEKTTSNNGVVVKGVSGLKIQLSKCCNPIPGDQITGYVSQGQGIKVHRVDCPNIKQKEIQSRLIDVYWDFASLSNLKFDADLQIDGLDRTNLLNDIITVLGQMKINILNIHADASDDGRALIKLKIGVDDAEHLNRAIANLERIQGIYDIKRVIH